MPDRYDTPERYRWPAAYATPEPYDWPDAYEGHGVSAGADGSYAAQFTSGF